MTMANPANAATLGSAWFEHVEKIMFDSPATMLSDRAIGLCYRTTIRDRWFVIGDPHLFNEGTVLNSLTNFEFNAEFAAIRLLNGQRISAGKRA